MLNSATPAVQCEKEHLYVFPSSGRCMRRLASRYALLGPIGGHRGTERLSEFVCRDVSPLGLNGMGDFSAGCAISEERLLGYQLEPFATLLAF